MRDSGIGFPGTGTMSPPNAAPTESELHAYIDDELPTSRRAEIAATLRQDADLAARVAAYETDRALLRMALLGIGDEPVPAAWTARIEAAMAPRLRTVPNVIMTRRFALAASVALVASVAAAIRWQRRDLDQTILLEAESARDGHLKGRLPQADPLPPPASRDALLRSTLGMQVRAPDLERFGFRLARMELFGRPGGGSAQLRYADQGQRALTIYVRPSDGNVRFDILRRGDTHICIWQDDVVGAVIIAPVSAAEMLRIASSAYTDLNF
jgi:anti-sigma factor RsiW